MTSNQGDLTITTEQLIASAHRYLNGEITGESWLKDLHLNDSLPEVVAETVSAWYDGMLTLDEAANRVAYEACMLENHGPIT